MMIDQHTLGGYIACVYVQKGHNAVGWSQAMLQHE
jgi:hypothetical protein